LTIHDGLATIAGPGNEFFQKGGNLLDEIKTGFKGLCENVLRETEQEANHGGIIVLESFTYLQENPNGRQKECHRPGNE